MDGNGFFSYGKGIVMFKDAQEREAFQKWVDDWVEDPMKVAFLKLKQHLDVKESTELVFKARPGVSYSLRAVPVAETGYDKPLFAMVDVVDDDPANRWLSVCFYGEMITDPDEQGDLIPGGLLGEDGYCFDMTEADEALLDYLRERLTEAHRSALNG